MEHNGISRKERCIFYIILIILFVWAMFRISKGVPWEDEAYYAALAKRLLLGQKPFFQIWSLHITSSFLIAPVMKVYTILPKWGGYYCF